jgi:membrane-associated protein
MLWVGSMLLAGHFLQQFVKSEWGYDLTEHLETIVLIIVAVTTFPVLYKVFFSKKKAKVVKEPENPVV